MRGVLTRAVVALAAVLAVCVALVPLERAAGRRIVQFDHQLADHTYDVVAGSAAARSLVRAITPFESPLLLCTVVALFALRWLLRHRWTTLSVLMVATEGSAFVGRNLKSLIVFGAIVALGVRVATRRRRETTPLVSSQSQRAAGRPGAVRTFATRDATAVTARRDR